MRFKLPLRPPEETKFSVRVNEITDKYIYNHIIADLISEMYSLSRTVRTTLTHDSLRSNFKDYLISHINDHERFSRYGKLKGWASVRPDYKTEAKHTNEPLSLGDAYHLWNHIHNRYSQLELTQFFVGFAHDVEFKTLMTLGMNTLKAQLQTLVQLALKYEVQLPERPPASLKGPIDPESLEDRFMYQQIFRGIDESVEMHIRAIIEVARNDSLRQVFVKLFEAELDIHDKMIKYGKLKGWAFIPPIYSNT